MNGLFYIDAEVEVRVPHISGPFLGRASYLVEAPDLNTAKQKFLAAVKAEHANKGPNLEFKVKFTTIAPKI